MNILLIFLGFTDKAPEEITAVIKTRRARILIVFIVFLIVDIFASVSHILQLQFVCKLVLNNQNILFYQEILESLLLYILFLI